MERLVHSKHYFQIYCYFRGYGKRYGRVNNDSIKTEIKEGTRVTQQKGRRISIQLQEQVDKEISNLLERGYIKKVDTIKDDVFIQSLL